MIKLLRRCPIYRKISIRNFRRIITRTKLSIQSGIMISKNKINRKVQSKIYRLIVNVPII